jgi:hypothetical protein
VATLMENILSGILAAIVLAIPLGWALSKLLTREPPDWKALLRGRGRPTATSVHFAPATTNLTIEIGTPSLRIAAPKNVSTNNVAVEIYGSGNNTQQVSPDAARASKGTITTITELAA